MDRQEMFDRAVKGLASQGWERSLGAGGKCSYRGVDGRRCAVGWLLDDEDVDGFAQVPYGGLPSHVRSKLGGDTHYCFVGHLQNAHDYGKTPIDMRCNLRNLAEWYGLALPAELEVGNG